MTALRINGVQVTDAGQRILGNVGTENNRGYGAAIRGGVAMNKLQRDGLVEYGYGPGGRAGRSWGCWLTETGRAVFEHLYGWADAPAKVDDRVNYTSQGTTWDVVAVSKIEVRLKSIVTGIHWTLAPQEFASWWDLQLLIPYVTPTPVSSVAAGDVLQMRGESSRVTVASVDDQITLSDGRVYTVAGMVFLANMAGFTIVPPAVPRLNRIKSTSGTRRRNRG